MNLLYRDNVFAFDHLDGALNLRQTTLKYRWNAIRTVCLQWRFRRTLKESTIPSLHNQETWQETCTALASLAGLEALYLYLQGYGIRTEQEDYRPILKPLCQITQAKVFKVEVTWTNAVCDDFNRKSDNDFPFELTGYSYWVLIELLSTSFHRHTR